ncbi:hypothetical protein M422DRAFT_98384, partial [Sphaerobolus stellatus SS14]
GRKPVLLIGLSTMAVSTIWFRMSKSFLSMLISRTLAGILRNLFNSTKLIVAELTDRINQASAFQYHLQLFRFGEIIGLPLGGFLARPGRHFSMFRNKFWKNHPFTLPCFMVGGFVIFSVILGYIYLPEVRYSYDCIRFPLFCFTPIELGGLGMSEAAI